MRVEDLRFEYLTFAYESLLLQTGPDIRLFEYIGTLEIASDFYCFAVLDDLEE